MQLSTMMIKSIVAVLLVASAGRHHLFAAGSVHCSIHGDTHVLMSDGTTKYQHHSGGLFRAFATAVGSKRLEVQCEFTDRIANQVGAPMPVASSNVADPEMSSCRLKIVDADLGCGIDVRHSGIQKPGYGFVSGQEMPLASMGQAAIHPALGASIIPLTNNGVAVEVNWNGTFIQVLMSDRSLQVHGNTVQSCLGLCGNCMGPQQAPANIDLLTTFIAQQAMDATIAIQPQLMCGAPVMSAAASGNGGGSQQQLLRRVVASQSSEVRYPFPAYKPPSLEDTVYQATFESQAVMNQVFSQCSNNNLGRLQFDPVFNSFVEDCMYDKSLGPGFAASAKASMDAFISWTESLVRMNRVQAALQMSPLMQLCAVCIPVQWANPVQTPNILDAAVTTRRGQFLFPMHYNGQNNYMLDAVVGALAGPNVFNQQWNSNIVLPSLSSLNLNQLPQSMMVAPLSIGGGYGTASGSCQALDGQSMQVLSAAIQSGQAQQLAALIRQGQYQTICRALLLCGSSSMTALAQLQVFFTAQQLQSICPISTSINNDQMYLPQNFGFPIQGYQTQQQQQQQLVGNQQSLGNGVMYAAAALAQQQLQQQQPQQQFGFF